MSLANNIRGWRLSRQQSVAVIAAKAGIPPDTLEAIESGEQDPSASMVEALASAIGIPAAWLYSDPKHLELLIEDDEDRNAAVSGGLDPVRERVLLGGDDPLTMVEGARDYADGARRSIAVAHEDDFGAARHLCHAAAVGPGQ